MAVRQANFLKPLSFFYGNVKWHFVSLRRIDAVYEEFRLIIYYIHLCWYVVYCSLALECTVLSGCLGNPQILDVYFSLSQEDISSLVWYFGNRSTLNLFKIRLLCQPFFLLHDILEKGLILPVKGDYLTNAFQCILLKICMIFLYFQG